MSTAARPDPNTPARFQAICEECLNPVNTEAIGVAQFITGWAVNRSGGGANRIALRTPHPRYLHPDCLAKLLSGHDPNQQSLI